jgi:TIR domain
VDKKRLTGGVVFDKALARAICESVCLIVVFTPRYEESSYCADELLAMEQIEEERKHILGSQYDETRRMIIPVILRGDNDSLPLKLKGIQSHSFIKFQMAGRLMKKNSKFIEKIDDIVQHIYGYYRDLKNLEKNGIVQNCDSFALPSKPTTEHIVKSTVRDDLPLRDI